jgi:hypothetical protein
VITVVLLAILAIPLLALCVIAGIWLFIGLATLINMLTGEHYVQKDRE